MAYDIKAATPDTSINDSAFLIGADSQSATDPSIYSVSVVRAHFMNSPTLVTPALGTPSSGTLTSCTGLPVSTGISGLGTNVATALAVNVGSAGAFVTHGGALGTPSSGTLTNATGLPIVAGTTGTLSVARGGTGATDAGGARTALGLEIGTNVQAFDAQLSDFAALVPTKGRLAVADGTNWLPLTVGTNTHVLTADSAETLGVKWAAPTGGGGSPGGSSGQLQWNSSSSFAGSYLWQTTDVIEQRNGTNAQTFRVYNTFTDASNYERGFMRWNANVFQIGIEAAGTGTTTRAVRYQGCFGATIIDSGAFNVQIGHNGAMYLGILSGDVLVRANQQFAFSGSSGDPVTVPDAGFARPAANIISVTNGSTGGGVLQFIERTAPAAPSTNQVRIYAEDNGSGKTRLMAIFATGAAQQIAIEP